MSNLRSHIANISNRHLNEMISLFHHFWTNNKKDDSAEKSFRYRLHSPRWQIYLKYIKGIWRHNTIESYLRMLCVCMCPVDTHCPLGTLNFSDTEWTTRSSIVWQASLACISMNWNLKEQNRSNNNKKAH